MSSVLTFLGRAAATLVILVGAAALLAGVIVPRLTGATPYTVLSGSMEPRYPVGTLLVVRPSDDVALGDVVTYQLESGKPEVVSHRVVGVGFTRDGEPAYTTQGDANAEPDRAAVRPVQIRGELWYAVPWLGRVSTLASGAQRQGAVTVIAVLLAAYAAWQAIRSAGERIERKKARA